MSPAPRLLLALLASGWLLLPSAARAGDEPAPSVVKETPFVVIRGEPARTAPREVAGDGDQRLVDDALRWLARHQATDGRWRLKPKQPDDDRDVIPTSLALLAFFGNGHTHRYGTYKLRVSKGLRWLKGRIDAKGRSGKTSEAPVLSQALICWIFAEAYFVTKDPFLKRYVLRVHAALRALEHDDGGYGFRRHHPPNALATSLVALAFKAVHLAALNKGHVPRAALDRLRDRLQACTGPKGRVGFRKPGQGVSLRPVARRYGQAAVPAPKVPLFTAGAVIARIFCYQRRSADPVRRGIRHLTPPHPQRNEPLYYYLATYANFQFGGKRWKAWTPPLLSTLRRLRRADGSWASAGIIGRLGGESGTTATNVLALEVIARYRRAQGD